MTAAHIEYHELTQEQKIAFHTHCMNLIYAQWKFESRIAGVQEDIKKIYIPLQLDRLRKRAENRIDTLNRCIIRCKQRYHRLDNWYVHRPV